MQKYTFDIVKINQPMILRGFYTRETNNPSMELK